MDHLFACSMWTLIFTVVGFFIGLTMGPSALEVASQAFFCGLLSYCMALGG